MFIRYGSPLEFEPLLPGSTAVQALLAQAHDLARLALPLASSAFPSDLRGLLRGMNSYYSNRIEGQHTRPFEIEQALRADFSSNRELAARQRLAVAHIGAEEALEARYASDVRADSDVHAVHAVHDAHDAHDASDAGATRAPSATAAAVLATDPDAAPAGLYAANTIADLHRELFSRLPASDLFTSEGEAIVPGQWRQRDVSVGRHVAPVASSLAAFLQRWATVYAGARRGEATLVAMAAAHQRLGWIHPFIDGNGRVMRLHSHLLLAACGYSGGLWSPLRGFARNTERYFALLAAADEPRRGDLDGRGSLSEQALVDWVAYVLDTCLDQVRFMAGMLKLSDIERRIAACLAFEEHTRRSGVRMAALRPLHYLFVTDAALERGEFKAMLGLGERTAGTVLKALLDRRLLASDSPQGKVRFGLPLHALRFYFPALWPEAEADDGDT